MNNQLQTKAATLAAILNSNRLTKESSQTIAHKSLTSQTSLGKEQTEDVADATQGVLASTEAAANPSKENVKEQNNAQSLNASGEEGISRDRNIKTITSDEEPTGTPGQQAKIASYYKGRLASVLAGLNKQAAEKDLEPSTGKEVLHKFASLEDNSTESQIKEAQDSLVKLASTNPVFHICKERILLNKFASDIQALAEAEGISEDEAAMNLQEAAEMNPEMLDEINEEANGEAVAELAEAEDATAELMGGVEELALNASNELQTEVTPDDILDAVEETIAMADELGVPPEALIEQAMAEMEEANAAEGYVEVTPEDEANAEMILEEAAANGISPEEVIQMAAEELEGGEVLAPPVEEGVLEEPVEKVAKLQKHAGTSRTAFVQELRRRR